MPRLSSIEPATGCKPSNPAGRVARRQFHPHDVAVGTNFNARDADRWQILLQAVVGRDGAPTRRRTEAIRASACFSVSCFSSRNCAVAPWRRELFADRGQLVLDDFALLPGLRQQRFAIPGYRGQSGGPGLQLGIALLQRNLLLLECLGLILEAQGSFPQPLMAVR